MNSKNSIFCFLLLGLFVYGCSKSPDIHSFASTASKKINSLTDFNGDKISELVFWNTSSMSQPGKYLEQCFYEIADVKTGKIKKIREGEIGDIPLLGYFDEDGIIDYCLYRSYFNSESEWFIKNGAKNDGYTLRLGKAGDIPTPNDYDGDGKCDAVAYDSENSIFKGIGSRTGNNFIYQLGLNNSIPTSKDFDGDGATDFAAYKPQDGTWLIKTSSNIETQQIQLGGIGFLPIPSDYDGDGKADLCVWNNKTGEIKLILSSQSISAPIEILEKVQKYISGKNLYPVPMDYDGNGISELAFWDSSSKLLLTFEVVKELKKRIYHFPKITNSFPVNNFYLNTVLPSGRLSTGPVVFSSNDTVLGLFNEGTALNYSLSSSKSDILTVWNKKGDVEPFISDFDGDYLNDSCLYSKDTGIFICNSSRGSFNFALPIGQKTDIPFIGMLNRDNITDIGVFRPQTLTFYIRYLGKFAPKDIQYLSFSNNNFTNSIPIISDYDGDKIEDLSIYDKNEKSFLIKLSSNGAEIKADFCMDTACKSNKSTPITGDFDGDGKNDPGIIALGKLNYLSSSSGKSAIIPLLQNTSEIAFSTDFDHDHKSDIAFFMTSTNNLTILESSKNWQHSEIMLAGIGNKKVKLVNSTSLNQE